MYYNLREELEDIPVGYWDTGGDERLEITEMTNDHLDGAIYYLERRRMLDTAKAKELLMEKRLRKIEHKY